MVHSPEFLAGRRRGRVRRRRAITVGTLTPVLCAAGAGIYLLNRTHHHIVVVRVARPDGPPNKAGTQTRAEYPAAAGAPSLNSVRAALATIESKRPASTHAAGARGS